jgi:predicted enzyme related to lactoylglutathione lyase
LTIVDVYRPFTSFWMKPSPWIRQMGPSQGPSSEKTTISIKARQRRHWFLVAAAQVTAASRICGMATRLVQINMKARDAAALGRFWAEVLGWGIESDEFGTSLEPAGFAYPDPAAVCIDIIASPEPKTVKNRVHVDLATTSAAHQAELVARLKDLGATPADVGQGDVLWTVMADPEGNEFCVLEPRPLYQGTGPIASVVVDCADPRAMARFWGEAMDWTLHEVTDDYAIMRSAKDVGPYLEFVRTPDAKTVWNRVHLDICPYPGDDLAAEEARLRTLGATDPGIDQSDLHWTVLVDPEDNEFCLLTPR